MDYEITNEALSESFKPYDIVTDSLGNIGFIQEVSINTCQPPPFQIQYSVTWLVGKNKHAWFQKEELTRHCNLFVKIAEVSCHPFGHNKEWVQKLFNL